MWEDLNEANRFNWAGNDWCAFSLGWDVSLQMAHSVSYTGEKSSEQALAIFFGETAVFERPFLKSLGDILTFIGDGERERTWVEPRIGNKIVLRESQPCAEDTEALDGTLRKATLDGDCLFVIEHWEELLTWKKEVARHKKGKDKYK